MRRIPDLRAVDLELPDRVLAWTPDGRSIAISRPGRTGIDLYAVATGERSPLVEGSATNVTFAPDGSTYAFEAGGGIWRGDTRTGDVKRIVATGSTPVWSPDSQRLAFLSDRDNYGKVPVHESPDEIANELYIADADGRHQQRLTRTTADESRPIMWSADATALLYSRWSVLNMGPPVRAFDIQRRCSAPLALSGVEVPPPLDPTGWDFRGSRAALHLAC